ncbi:ribosome biogenesis GTPase YlqF [Carnobacterium sp.]|uniref:ribosome biogenesis GTPase YlqF n=1 Tax=Carnobacterium sp. TaxID=48221 RepID=UPI002FCC28CA
MTIQWFPGHMAKARREVSEKLKLVDIVFELVDARIPLSSRNPILDELIGEKPRVIILNKSDLADERQTKAWVNYFKEQGISAVPIVAQEGKGMQNVMSEAKLLLKEKFDRMRSKGINPRAIRAMSIGIPNVGKSTLINRFIKRNIAKTGNKPGVTKGQQWLKLGKELELLDTPGILWPKFEDPEIGKKLALTGAIKDTLLQMDDIALFGLDVMRTYYPNQLAKRYSLTKEEVVLELPELLILISEKRGFREDYSRASEMIVFEIRSGRLGRYTLDQAPVTLPTEGLENE